MTVKGNLINDFSPFFNDMIEELMKHYPEKGDTWKTCDESILVGLFYDAMSEIIKEGLVDIDHLLDISAISAMIYLRKNGIVFHRYQSKGR